LPKIKTVPGHRLIISLPVKDPSRLGQLFPAGQPTQFLYLGVDFVRRNRLERQLGSRFSRLDITELHDRVAREIRSKHIQWIDQLNRRYGQEIEWWFNPIASRNIYVSNLFQYSCYLEILERIWKHGDAKPDLIFVETPALAAAIRKWAIHRGIEVQVNFAKPERFYQLSCYWSSLLRYGFFVVTLLMRRIAAYASRKKIGAKICPPGKLAIVDIFLRDVSLNEQGGFNDNYFPHLYEYLEKNGFQILVHPVLYGFSFNYFSIYRRMRKSDTHFIIPEDYLKLSDYIHVLMYPLRAYRLKITADPFRNLDLYDIINEDYLRGLTDNLSLLAGLIQRVMVRLGQSGLAPRLIISWYENQVIDKALVAAARQAFPQAIIIGAQIFIFSSNLLYLFPIQSEVEAGIVPHRLLEMSEHLCNFAQTFTKDIPCYPAASLRYAHIFQAQQEASPAKTGSTVLVLLPYALAEAAEILEILIMALDHIPKAVRLWIKCHPAYSARELQRVFGGKNWPERFEFWQGTLAEALKEATVVISSNSSAMAEAAAMAIPVIFLGRQTALNQNVLEDVKSELIMECFTADELVAAVNQALSITSHDKRYKALGEEILNMFFSPVTPETMQPFLGEDDV
jgi:hypothetical protein